MAKKEEIKEVDPNPEKALEAAISGIEKDFGAGTIMVGEGRVAGISWLSSGCVGLNRALGGGYPKGRIIELYGAESSGKSTLCLHAVAEAQKLGQKACYVDVEHAFDPVYAATVGVKVNELLITQPSCGEDALETVRRLISSNALSLIVVDSTNALVPRVELEGQMADNNMGLQARLMSKAMRILCGCAYQANTLVMMVSQIRSKIGIVYGNPNVAGCGNALKFYASQRLDISKTGNLKDGEEITANTVRVKVAKNKCAPPFREAEFNIVYGMGIDVMDDLLTCAVNDGVIEKAGSWYSFDGGRIGQGAQSVAETLRNDPGLVEKIKAKLK